jgi:hypothetical protein
MQMVVAKGDSDDMSSKLPQNGTTGLVANNALGRNGQVPLDPLVVHQLDVLKDEDALLLVGIRATSKCFH